MTAGVEEEEDCVEVAGGDSGRGGRKTEKDCESEEDRRHQNLVGCHFVGY